MISHHSFDSVCVQKKIIAPSVYELSFSKPETFSFQAGQFVLFDVPLLENPTDIQPRAYSIASSPSEKNLLFVIKLVPNGRASVWIEKVVDTGTVVRMQGPFGAFTFDTATEKPSLLIATGTGIAPFRSQILWALKDKTYTGPIHLLFGVLKRDDLFWEEELKNLEVIYPTVHIHISFLDGTADWHRESGSLQDRFPQILKATPSARVYICGSPAIVKEMKDHCLALGLPKTDIHSESYI